MESKQKNRRTNKQTKGQITHKRTDEPHLYSASQEAEQCPSTAQNEFPSSSHSYFRTPEKLSYSSVHVRQCPSSTNIISHDTDKHLHVF